LNYKGLGELGGDGVVGSGVLYDQTLVAIDTLEDRGLLDSPFADVGPVILRLVVLLCVGGLPARLPVVRKLLQERSLEGGGLHWIDTC
jgi:hypothetical protein